MSNLEIFVSILGDSPASDKMFSIIAQEDTSISTWRRRLQAKKQNSLKGYDAASLTLWKLKQAIPLANVDQEVIWPLGHDFSGIAEKMLPANDLLDYFPVPPPRKSLHVIAVLPNFPSAGEKHDRSEDDGDGEPASKRKKGPRHSGPREGHRYGPVDITHSLLTRWSEWNMPLPSISSLAARLRQPLRNDEKVPVLEHDIFTLVTKGSPMTLCTRDELKQLVRSSEEEEANYIWLVMKAAITFDPPAGDGTEASFISFWDRNIRAILETIVSSSKTVRDSNQGTNTGLFRPDYGFLVRGICVFRGEEKPPVFSGTNPKAELGNNLIWTYEPAPYLLGYYAVGTEITLVAITATEVIDLDVVDLSYKAQRVKFIIYLLRLSSLLKPIATLVGHRADPELETLDRLGGKTVSIGARAIMKTFQGDGHGHHTTYLQGIYRILKEKAVPNVDSLTTWRIEPTISTVYLEPKGRNRLPDSEQEVRDCVGCILEALKIMHAEPKPMFHRDIRWPNVIQRADVLEKWFLIDWDDAAIYPTRARPQLSTSNHFSSVFQDGHGAEVDLWAVGKIICEAGAFVPGMSPEMMAFAKRLMELEITSADQALDDLRQFRGKA